MVTVSSQVPFLNTCDGEGRIGRTKGRTGLRKHELRKNEIESEIKDERGRFLLILLSALLSEAIANLWNHSWSLREWLGMLYTSVSLSMEIWLRRTLKLFRVWKSVRGSFELLFPHRTSCLPWAVCPSWHLSPHTILLPPRALLWLSFLVLLPLFYHMILVYVFLLHLH